MKWSDLSDEQKDRVIKFSSGDTKQDLILYRMHKNNPEKFRREPVVKKSNKFIKDYLEQFKSKFIKEL